MIVYSLIGVVFGIVGGMGLGGGIVLIPVLTLVMSASQHEAQGMTLFAYIPMAIAALAMHIKKGSVKIKEVIGIAAFGIVGGVAGYFLASVVDAKALRFVFAAFLILIALLRVYKQEIKPRVGK